MFFPFCRDFKYRFSHEYKKQQGIEGGAIFQLFQLLGTHSRIPRGTQSLSLHLVTLVDFYSLIFHTSNKRDLFLAHKQNILQNP